MLYKLSSYLLTKNSSKIEKRKLRQGGVASATDFIMAKDFNILIITTLFF